MKENGDVKCSGDGNKIYPVYLSPIYPNLDNNVTCLRAKKFIYFLSSWSQRNSITPK